MTDLAWAAAQFDARRAGHSLPQGLYTDQRAFDFDMAAIFGSSWLAAGFECELPLPGSYMAMTVGAWPLIITRDRHGEIHAFHNSCRHRGSILCQPGHGQAARLVCPYHHWTYDLDGRLLAASRMGEDFAKSEHGLKPVAIRCVAGAIFICLSDSPPPFDDFAEAFTRYAAPFDYRNAKVATSVVLIEYANWKLVMENARECYHCTTGHPELAKTFPAAMSRHFEYGEDARIQAFEARMDELGLARMPLEGDWWQLARFALNPGYVAMSPDGQHLSKKLMCEIGDGDIGSMRWAIDPHLFAHSTPDHTIFFNSMPVGPTETHVFTKWLVHKDAVEGVDYHLDSLTDLWNLTNMQDKLLAENNQAGVRSPGYTPGPYSWDAEMLAQRFIDWYCDLGQSYIAGHGAHAFPAAAYVA